MTEEDKKEIVGEIRRWFFCFKNKQRQP